MVADLNAEQLSAQCGLLVADSAYTFETQHNSGIKIVGQKASVVTTQVGQLLGSMPALPCGPVDDAACHLPCGARFAGLPIVKLAETSWSRPPAPHLFKHKEFNFEKLGIGGLDNQFEQIFRRAFASRVFPPSVVERLGIRHVRGVLLYGPPGGQKLQLCAVAGDAASQ